MKKTLIYVFVCVLISFGFSSCHKENNPEENIIDEAVKDVDGNTYTAVKIGNQVWMAENLRTTKYADGTEIPLDTMEGPSRYYPDSTAASVDKYGYFYNWKAVVNADPDSLQGNVQGICPNGWHVPSNAEWQELVEYVWSQMNPNKSYDKPTKALASKEGWNPSPNTGAPGCEPSRNNSMGFSALPAGVRLINVDDNILSDNDYIGTYAYFWSSSYHLDYYNGKAWLIDSWDTDLRNEDLVGVCSVRCLRD